MIIFIKFFAEPNLITGFRICRVVMHLFSLGILFFVLIWWDYEMVIVSSDVLVGVVWRVWHSQLLAVIQQQFGMALRAVCAFFILR